MHNTRHLVAMMIMVTIFHNVDQGSPFLKCVASIWALPGRGGGLPEWFGALFFTFARLTKGEGSKAIWAIPR